MYLRQIIKKLYKELFRFIPALIWSFSKIQPTNIQIVNPPKGNIMLLVKKSIKLKKSKPKNDTSFQILNEKILPKPNTQANKPKIITPNFVYYSILFVFILGVISYFRNKKHYA